MKEQLKSMSAIWWNYNRVASNENAIKVYDFLSLLKEHNKDLFGDWYELGTSKKNAMLNKVHLTAENIRDKLDKNWDKKFDDLGTGVSFWTGHDDDDLSASISFKLGGYGRKPFNKNSCVLNLPNTSPFYESLENQNALKNLLVKFWHPDKILINGEAVF